MLLTRACQHASHPHEALHRPAPFALGRGPNMSAFLASALATAHRTAVRGLRAGRRRRPPHLGPPPLLLVTPLCLWCTTLSPPARPTLPHLSARVDRSGHPPAPSRAKSIANRSPSPTHTPVLGRTGILVGWGLKRRYIGPFNRGYFAGCALAVNPCCATLLQATVVRIVSPLPHHSTLSGSFSAGGLHSGWSTSSTRTPTTLFFIHRPHAAHAMQVWLQLHWLCIVTIACASIAGVCSTFSNQVIVLPLLPPPACFVAPGHSILCHMFLLT